MPSRYGTKRWLLRPVIAVRRRRAKRLGKINVKVFEANAYSPAFRRFFLAARENGELLVEADLRENAVLLDVGAYHGLWTERVLRRADAAGRRDDLHVEAFEPVPSVVDQFHERIGDDPRVRLHTFGVGGRGRVESLGIAGPGSSFVAGPARFGTVEVELRDIDAVLTSLGVDRIDLVKINIEGGEYELIDRMYESGWLERTGSLIVQFHEFVPGARRARRRNRRQLARTHRCVWNYPWVYERWERR